VADEKTGLVETHARFLPKVPRRTNECWLGDLDSDRPLYVCGHKFLTRLEGTALRIWQLIDGSRTMEDIIDRLTGEFVGADRETIAEQTIGYMIQLERAGLAAWRSRPLFEGVELDD